MRTKVSRLRWTLIRVYIAFCEQARGFRGQFDEFEVLPNSQNSYQRKHREGDKRVGKIYLNQTRRGPEIVLVLLRCYAVEKGIEYWEPLTVTIAKHDGSFEFNAGKTKGGYKFVPEEYDFDSTNFDSISTRLLAAGFLNE